MRNIPRRLYDKLDLLIRTNLPKIEQEISETKELSSLLYKWSRYGKISAEEKKKIKVQMIDILKSIPALAIFIAPFGTIILYLCIKYLPFNILPSAFAPEIKKPGIDETDQLKPDK